MTHTYTAYKQLKLVRKIQVCKAAVQGKTAEVYLSWLTMLRLNLQLSRGRRGPALTKLKGSREMVWNLACWIDRTRNICTCYLEIWYCTVVYEVSI